MTSDWTLSHGKGPRAAFRERGVAWMCIGFQFVKMCGISLQLPFKRYPIKNFRSNRTDKSENFPLGGVHTCLKSRIKVIETISRLACTHAHAAGRSYNILTCN